MKARRFPVIIMLLLVTLLVTTTALADSSTEPPYDGEPATQFQTELAEAITQRQAAGLPIPEITFTTSTQVESLSTFSMLQADSSGEDTVTTTSTTVVYFDGPQEAGYLVWPDVEISGMLAGDTANSFTTGNLTEDVRNGVDSQYPGFWNYVDFGKEAREYTITETTEVAPGSGPPPAELSLLNSLQISSPEDVPPDPVLPTTTEPILMGFTYTGPSLDYSIRQQVKSCAYIWPFGNVCVEWAYIKAGFALDWALGLRLPAEVTLSQTEGADPAIPAFETSLTPQNWSVAEYSSYNVAPEPNAETETDGNEFVLRLEIFAGVQVRVLGAELVYGLNINQDHSQSFTTPFGDNSGFSIFEITIPLITFPPEDDDNNNDDDDGLVGSGIFEISIGLAISPVLGSDKITADWSATDEGGCEETGTLEYGSPGIPVLIPISKCTPGEDSEISVVLNNFRYYLNQFSFDIGPAVSIRVLTLQIEPDLEPLFNLPLNSIFNILNDSPFYLGDHKQCNFKFECGRVGPDNILVLGSYSPPADETPPIITPIISGMVGKNGWYTSKVTLTWEVIDYESDITSPACEPVEITSDQADTEYICTAASAGGESTEKVTIKRDATPPEFSCPTAGPFVLNSGDHAIRILPEDVDASISGLDTTLDPETGLDINVLEGIVKTESVGTKTIIFRAFDLAGNDKPIDCGYDVVYNASGFLEPVEAMNVGKAGRTYPIKWQLTDANGAYVGDLSVIKSISVQPSTMCSTIGTEPTMIELSSNESTWRYDNTDNQYIYNWKTPSTPGCWALELTLDSGQKEAAIFALK